MVLQIMSGDLAKDTKSFLSNNIQAELGAESIAFNLKNLMNNKENYRSYTKLLT